MEIQDHDTELQMLQNALNEANSIAFGKESELERLNHLIYDLETYQTVLKIEMQDHDTELQMLQNALNETNIIALDKEFELDSLQDDFKEKEIVLNDHVKNLSLAIETEQLIYSELQNKFDYLNTEVAVQTEKLKELERELETAHISSNEQNQQIALLNHEIGQKNEQFLAAKQLHQQLKAELVEKDQSNASLNELLAAHQKELAEIKESYAFNERFNSHLNELLDVREKELIQVNDAYFALTASNENLNELVTSYEKELGSAMLAHVYHEQSTVHLESNLLNLEKQLLDLQCKFAENSALNDNITLELKLYKEALDNALVLEDLEKRTAQERELKLGQINQLLKTREDELSKTKETLDHHLAINEELKSEKQKQEDSFKLTLQQYEETGAKSIETEKTLVHQNDNITLELKLYKEALDNALVLEDLEKRTAQERELKLGQINQLLKTREDELSKTKETLDHHLAINEELKSEKQKQEDSFKLALKQYEEAEAKSMETEKTLVHLFDMLKLKEQQLLDSEIANSQTKEYLDKLEQLRHNLQSELEKISTSYANLLSHISNKDEKNKPHVFLPNWMQKSVDILRN